MIGVGIGIPFFRSFGGGIDAQAQAHFNRVIADGGVVPSGLSGVNAFFSAVKAIYGTSDINTAISAAYDPHYLGYRLGAGSGTTLGQAARTLYSIKSTENLLLQSEDFANANWTKVGTTITSNSITAPNGTLTADTLVENTSTGQHASFQILNGLLPSQTYTFSIYVKYNDRRYINISSYLNQTPFPVYQGVFDILNGVFVSQSSGSGGTIVNSSISSVGDGWYRISVAGQVAANSNNIAFQISLLDDSLNNSYLGTSKSIYVWGAQVNVNQILLPYSQTTSTQNLLADVTQTTAASQPLLLAHTGENYWWGSGASGNLATTPNAAANQITGDIEYIVKCNFANTGNIIGVGKFAGGGVPKGMSFTLKNDIFTFYYSISNVEGSVSDNTITNFPANGQDVFIKVTRNSTTGLINVTSSTDGITYNNNIASVTGPTGALDAGNQELWVGPTKITGIVGAKIYRVTIANSIGGTPVVDFNPSSYNPATSQTQWSSATGEVWSINVGTATTGYKGVLVDRSIVQGDGIDDGLVTGSNIIMNTQFTLYGAFRGYNNEGGSGKSTFGKQNIDGSVFRNIATFLGSWIGANGSFQLNQTADSTKLNLATFKRKVSSNTLQVNNGAVATNTASTAITQSAISVFSVTTYGSSNSLFTTGLFSYIEDDATQKTAMYNYLRSLNNNAF